MNIKIISGIRIIDKTMFSIVSRKNTKTYGRNKFLLSAGRERSWAEYRQNNVNIFPHYFPLFLDYQSYPKLNPKYSNRIESEPYHPGTVVPAA